MPVRNRNTSIDLVVRRGFGDNNQVSRTDFCALCHKYYNALSQKTIIVQIVKLLVLPKSKLFLSLINFVLVCFVSQFLFYLVLVFLS